MNKILAYKNEILLSIFSIIFTLICLELVLHFWKNYPGPLGYPDKSLGYILRSGVDKNMTNSESGKNVRVRTNSFGFRDEEWDLSDESRKILVVGDSFVAGFETDEENRFTEILGKILDKADHVNPEALPRDTPPARTGEYGYKVLNMGIPGSGPEAYILRIEKYLKKVNPEYLFFVVYNGNDLANLNYNLTPDTGRINFVVKNSEVVQYKDIASFKEKLKWEMKTFLGKIYLVQFANDVYLKSKTNNLTSTLPTNTDPLYCGYDSIELDNSLKILKLIISRAQNLANENNTKFVLVNIPEKNELTFVGSDNCSSKIIQNALADFTLKEKISYVDMFEIFKKSSTSPYITEHLSDHGHALVGGELSKVFEK